MINVYVQLASDAQLVACHLTQSRPCSSDTVSTGLLPFTYDPVLHRVWSNIHPGSDHICSHRIQRIHNQQIGTQVSFDHLLH